MGVSWYVAQGGSRILDANRVDKSEGDNADVTEWVIGDDFILAVNIHSNGKDTEAAQYKLRWRNVSDSGSFADVSNTGEITYVATTDLTDGTAIEIGGRKCSTQGDTWQNGEENEGDNSCDSIDLADDYETEIHWALDTTNALKAKEYAFELYDTTNSASRGTCGATLTMELYVLAGVSKNSSGTALATCECFLCKDNQDNTCSYVDYAQSDGSGNYSFTGLGDNDAQYFVISWKDNTPHVFDVTDHVLQPV